MESGGQYPVGIRIETLRGNCASGTGLSGPNTSMPWSSPLRRLRLPSPNLERLNLKRLWCRARCRQLRQRLRASLRQSLGIAVRG